LDQTQLSEGAYFIAVDYRLVLVLIALIVGAAFWILRDRR
jgi:hypothetical protein